MTLNDHCSVVTGGSRGLGKAIALTLADRGADVVVGYRQDSRAAEEVVDQIESAGRRGKAIQVDVAQRSSCESFVEAATGFLGRLDSIVNNAGSLHLKPFLELTGEEWDIDIVVNLGGVFHCSQFAAREMVRQRQGGAIAIVTSCGASLVRPQQPNTALRRPAPPCSRGRWPMNSGVIRFV